MAVVIRKSAVPSLIQPGNCSSGIGALDQMDRLMGQREPQTELGRWVAVLQTGGSSPVPRRLEIRRKSSPRRSGTVLPAALSPGAETR